MKYIVPIILMITFSYGNQTKNEISKSLKQKGIKNLKMQQVDRFDKEKAVLHIRELFNKINEQAKNAEIIEKDMMGESTEGGQLKAYKYAGEIIKLIMLSFGENGKVAKEYYFENQQLIFAFTKEEYYDRPMYVLGSKISKTVENRYYFYNEELFKWLNPEKNEVNLSTIENTSEEILNEAKSYLKRIN